MIRWQDAESALVRDGSNWEVFVHKTDATDWQRVLNEIKARGFSVVYNARKEDQPLVSASEIFALDRPTSLLSLYVWDRGTRFNTYFDETEIMFDVHPREIHNQETLDHLTDFIMLLGNATQKLVQVSPDSLHDFVFLTYSPSDNEYRITPIPPLSPDSPSADEILAKIVKNLK